MIGKQCKLTDQDRFEDWRVLKTIFKPEPMLPGPSLSTTTSRLTTHLLQEGSIWSSKRESSSFRWHFNTKIPLYLLIYFWETLGAFWAAFHVIPAKEEGRDYVHLDMRRQTKTESPAKSPTVVQLGIEARSHALPSGVYQLDHTVSLNCQPGLISCMWHNCCLRLPVLLKMGHLFHWAWWKVLHLYIQINN